MKLIRQLKDKLGDFWWYAIMLFLACRLADFFNVFVGLYLVPMYVKPEELGAVLPLTNFAGLLGLPITIIITTFSRQITTFAAQREYGKIKMMMRDVFLWAGVFSVLIVVLAEALIPFVFVRLRVAKGSLGLIIVASTMITTIAPIYGCALQALKRFKAVSLIHILSAPIRLACMFLAMLIRPLSGYFVGQAAGPVFQIGAGLFFLRKDFGREVKKEAYLTPALKRSLLKYMLLLFVYNIPGVICGFFTTLIIRQRLPEIDSAAYYMISRFAEIASFVGCTLMTVLFPMAVEANAHGDKSRKLLWHSVLGSIGIGLLLAAGFRMTGGFILPILPNGELYVSYAPQLTWLTVNNALGIAFGCFINFEIAAARFKFLWYHIPLCLIETAILVGFTGITFFNGILPDSIISAILSLNPCSLDFFLALGTILSLIRLVGFSVHLSLRKKHEVATV